MKQLAKELMTLLQMHSPSGNEALVASYLYVQLKNLLGDVSVDPYGNLLAQKQYGDSGYTVLLSAHMDTVASVPPIPTWRKGKKEIYTKSGSALGGDDKCGLAAHLAIIRQLNKQTNFKGTIKVCFSREEEIGCVGAKRAVQLNPKWFEGIDAAIVIDRRGGRDIIDGGGWDTFCSDEYADFWLDMANETGFAAIRETGTISDTMIFSELGINGVNLSAGYYNAHTSSEYIVIAEVKRTVQWVCNALNAIEGYGKFPTFEYESMSSRWDIGGYGKYGYLWGVYGKKDDKKGKDECGYCEECNALFDIEDLIMDEEGRFVCLDCEEEMWIPTECANCLRVVDKKDTIERFNATICGRCVADILLLEKVN